MKPYWQIGLLTAEEANSLCSKENQNKAVEEGTFQDQEELKFLAEILFSIRYEASNKALDWFESYTEAKHKQMLPKICLLLKELGYDAYLCSFKDINGAQYLQLCVSW